MTEFTLHTEESAPEGSKALLADSLAGFGMIPGLHATMAESPALLEAYKVVHKLFMETSFDNDEKTVIWQTINVENSCHYCVPAHTGIAKSMGVDDAITNALRDKSPLPNPRLEALRDFTLSLMNDRGDVDDAKVQAFLDAGFTKQNILEVIVGLSQKVMSNYTNHLANTPVDKPFQKFAWNEAA